jgi:protein-S-isoprenylcysteine O-methyltransferase Ste14
MRQPADHPDMRKVWSIFAAEAVVFALLLFGAAGTLAWASGWVFLAVFFGASTLILLALARDDPALLAERMRPPFQAGQPLWDKVILAALFALFVGWLPLVGLERRFGGSHMPALLQWIGAVGLVAAMWIFHVSTAANPFLAAVVRIQTERGHEVVSSGPYAVVRHPLYAGALLLFPSCALLLGSWWGLAASLPLAALILLRTILEDRELRRSLRGMMTTPGASATGSCRASGENGPSPA